MERHRHRYEFNNAYREVLTANGLVLSGVYREGDLVEVVEIADHPWFLGCQFHPEFKSQPTCPHPLFAGFVGAAARRHLARSDRGKLVHVADENERGMRLDDGGLNIALHALVIVSGEATDDAQMGKGAFYVSFGLDQAAMLGAEKVQRLVVFFQNAKRADYQVERLIADGNVFLEESRPANQAFRRRQNERRAGNHIPEFPAVTGFQDVPQRNHHDMLRSLARKEIEDNLLKFLRSDDIEGNLEKFYSFNCHFSDSVMAD